MRRKFYTFLCLLSSLLISHAQTASKLDPRLLRNLKQGKVYDGSVSLIVKGNLDQIKTLTKKLSGVYKYGYGDIASVSIPQKNVIEFSNNLAVRKIQSTMAKGVYLMDTARIRNNIDSANWGSAPLHDSLLGKNVIVGIIDGGIYWQQKDFKNPDGTTRILYIWDQTSNASQPPIPYLYGAEWSAHDINAGNCAEVEAYGAGATSNCPSDFGHGTCVAGIASGNGSSVADDPFLRGKYTGVAPQSNLIVVNAGTGNPCVPSGVDFLTQISDAVTYIFEKADALGLPCVINTSVGTYYGSHDGLDLTTELIANLLNQRNGRALVAAAGNAGNIRHHLGYQITSDTAYTLFSRNAAGNYVYFDLWADTANFNNAWFTFTVNNDTGALLGQLPYMNVPLNFSTLLQPNVASTMNIGISNGTIPLGSVAVSVTLDSNRYHIEFEFDNPASTTNLYSLRTFGSGSFDLWASSGLMGTSDIVPVIVGALNDTVIFPSNYRYPDYHKTIVSSWQCSDQVITVGNYSNRAGYWDVDSNYVDLTSPAYGAEVVGKRFVSSSFGPTRDNRVKPDIIASGSTILCTGDANDIAITLNPSNRFKVALGGKHLRNGGTSMSSPIVAGIAALYFQKRPTATWQEIKKALICTAVTDSFTGSTPNSGYGYGKVNAFQALSNATCIVYGALDTSCINYNPLANIDTGGCVTKVYGVQDTACVNYNPLANINNGSCVAKVYGCTDPNAANYDSAANVDNGHCTYTGIANVTAAQIGLSVMPNPFSKQVTFSLSNNGYSFTNGVIEITNDLGEKVETIAVSPASANYIYDNHKLAAGIYFYRLKLDNKVVKSGKLVAE